MSSSLEALLKLSGHTSLEELKATDGLSLQNRGLTSVPESIGQLTKLTGLGLDSLQLSSLPESIGQLTNLKELYLYNNPVCEIPAKNMKVAKLTHSHRSPSCQNPSHA
eukprot:TRINITY_DN395_c0_g1_i1.p1 TRINITY_DN395_c0_g1~~TRINITY_DN395_c0_g1_i1.p1  ORF type:complete len:108 (-),score=16.87 TRINITY_DN395_c0_g1_i1:18-341(-)